MASTAPGHVISGQVTGDLGATQRLGLRRPARVFGDIEAPIVTIEEGVLFQSRCQMLPANAEPASHAAEPGAARCRPAQTLPRYWIASSLRRISAFEGSSAFGPAWTTCRTMPSRSTMTTACGESL